jgi:hypothetical protein
MLMIEKLREQKNRKFSSLLELRFMMVFFISVFSFSTVIGITFHISPSQQQAIAQQTNTTLALPQVNATRATGDFLPYDNATLGVKIQYPSNWENFEQENAVLFISPFQSDLDRYRETVGVSLIRFVNNVSLDEFVSNTTNFLSTSANDFELYVSTPTSLGSLPAHMLVYSYSDPLIGMTRAMALSTLLDDKYLYTITYSAKPAEYGNSLPTAQRMIDTFQPYTPTLQ